MAVSTQFSVSVTTAAAVRRRMRAVVVAAKFTVRCRRSGDVLLG
jgi:hypothetical protein